MSYFWLIKFQWSEVSLAIGLTVLGPVTELDVVPMAKCARVK